MKKLLSWAAVALLVFFVVHNPDGAASAAQGLGNGLLVVAQGFSNFAGKLAG